MLLDDSRGQNYHSDYQISSRLTAHNVDIDTKIMGKAVRNRSASPHLRIPRDGDFCCEYAYS